MEVIVAVTIAVLAGGGVFLMLGRHLFPVVLGIVLLSQAVNLFVFAMGRLLLSAPPLVTEAPVPYADPLPQALVLTAIVISFGMTATVIALAVWSRTVHEGDEVESSPKSDGESS